MTTLIEKLEGLQRFTRHGIEGENGAFILADDLRAIIESANKEMQEPAAYQIRILGERWAGCAKHIYNPNNPNTRALFTNPPLSDETVKDAAIGKLVREKMKSGNDVPVSRCIITKEEFDAAS